MTARRPPSTRSLLAILAVVRWSSVRPTLLIVGAVAMLVAAGAGLLLPRALGRVAAALPTGTDAPWRSAVALVLVQLLATYGGRVAIGIAAMGALTSLRTRLFARLLHAPMTFHDGVRSADLASVLGADAAYVQETLGAMLPSFAMAVPLLFGAAALAAATSWRLTLVAALAAIPVAAMPLLTGHRLRAVGRRSQRFLAQLGAIAQESFAALRAVKVANWQATFGVRFDAAAMLLHRERVRRVQWQAALDAIAPATALGAVVVLVAVGTREVALGRADGPRLVAFAGYASTCGMALLLLLRSYTSLELAAGAASRFSEVLSPGTDPEVERGATIGRARGAIELEGVTFRWPGGRLALDDVSLRVAPGEVVGIAGRNGAGKSTIVQLLLRLYAPEAGEIRLDGRSASRVALSAWRRQFALVSRDPALFALSIRDNIALGRPGASRAQIEEAVAAVGLHETVARLPRGYDTLLGEAGLGLSAGQQQRLALARAILQDAPVVILDEATTSLDRESEARFAAVVRAWAGRKTVLVVSHGSLLGLPIDRTVQLEDGAVVEPTARAPVLAR